MSTRRTLRSGLSGIRRMRGLRHRRGYAMGLYLVTMSILTTTVVMLLGTAATESRNAYKQAQLTEAKAVGLSAIDSYFARLQTQPGFPKQGANVDVSSTGWYRMADGVVSACADDNLPCYRLSEREGLNARSPVRTVTATVRYGCRGGGCSTLYLSQRIRAWNLTDFLFYTQYNVVSPGFEADYPGLVRVGGVSRTKSNDPCATDWATRVARNLSDNDCTVISYTDADRISGPVYSADSFVAVCSDNPANIFANIEQVWSLPSGTQSPIRPISEIRNDPGCYNFSPASYGRAAPVPLRLPSARTTFDAVSKGNDQVRNLCGDIAIRFGGRDLLWQRVGGTGCGTGPSSGVLGLTEGQVVTVSGDAIIKGGTFDGRASLFARNDVLIEGDLTYVSSREDQEGDVLGVNAGGDIKIDCKPLLRIEAYLISLNGSVYTSGLDSCGAGRLDLLGGVASRYQGVFGLYDPATGLLAAGFEKSFNFDERAGNNVDFLPPQLITPNGRQWVRLDLAEVYCDSSSCP